MSIKKKLAMGIATGALAVSMIGGGTYAYFSDTAVSENNKFAAGTLDINVTVDGKADKAIIDVANIKPGDTMTREFKINNIGTLNVSKVLLTSKYTTVDAKGDNTASDDIGKHIKVKFLKNKDKVTKVIHETTLSDLSKYDAVENTNWLDILGEADGLKNGDSDTLEVQFEFVDNKQDQNVFQGDSLQLEWTFDAKQTSGEKR